MRDWQIDIGIGLGLAALASGAVGVVAALFGDLRVAFDWSVAAAALFMLIAVAGALFSPERSIATAAFLLFGCVAVMATMLTPVSVWLGDFLKLSGGQSVTYVWHGQSFTPSAGEILFGSVSVLGFVGSGALFFVGGLIALARAMPRQARPRTEPV